MPLSAMINRWPMASLSLLGCLLVVATPRCEAQNLVPNPSFEELDTCPYWPGFQLGDRPVGWYSWNGTPEYFHSCAQQINGMDTVVGVPRNGWGFQYPWDGEAYVGVYSFATGSQYREFVGAELLCPLVAGRTYHVAFRVNLASGGATWSAGGACNNIGALFTMESNAWTSNSFPPSGPSFSDRNMAHVYSTEIISDTVNWVLVEGNFQADSAYQHIVLGNFFDNAHTDTTPSEIGFVLAYFLIDSVSVTSAFKECTPTGANPIIASNRDMVYYDQVSGDLVIEPKGDGPVDYVVVDAFGRYVTARKVGGLVRMNTASWTEGVYFLHARSFGQRQFVKFVVVR